jgi:hypothetical protein
MGMLDTAPLSPSSLARFLPILRMKLRFACSANATKAYPAAKPIGMYSVSNIFEPGMRVFRPSPGKDIFVEVQAQS